MCLLLSSNNSNILWVQKILLLQPQEKDNEFIQLYANILVDVLGTNANLSIIHPDVIDDVRNVTEEWNYDDDWIKKMIQEKIETRSVRKLNGELYEIYYTKNAFREVRVGPTDQEVIKVWPDEKLKNRIIEKGKWNIPFSRILVKNIPSGCQIIRISGRTKSGVHRTYSQTTFHLEGAYRVLPKIERACDRVDEPDLREDFFGIINSWRKFDRDTKNIHTPRYDIVVSHHPECPTSLELKEGNLKYYRQSLDWPLESENSKSRLFILYPLDKNFDLEFVSEVCPKTL